MTFEAIDQQLQLAYSWNKQEVTRERILNRENRRIIKVRYTKDQKYWAYYNLGTLRIINIGLIIV